jgi:5'-phosphate synthase pdxT subunit
MGWLSAKPRIAVLAMQGDFEKHIQTLERLGVDAFSARLPADIEKADGIILPGGESTTIGKLLRRYGVDDAIRSAFTQGKPIYGTCAGLILIASRIVDETAERGGQLQLGFLDVTVARNAFGRQVDSFEADLDIPVLGDPPLRAIFIRAPAITETGTAVDTLSSYDSRPVLVRQGSLLGSSFHPELSGDDRIHRLFLSMFDES